MAPSVVSVQMIPFDIALMLDCFCFESARCHLAATGRRVLHHHVHGPLARKGTATARITLCDGAGQWRATVSRAVRDERAWRNAI